MTSLYECVKKTDLRYLDVLLNSGAEIDGMKKDDPYVLLSYAILQKNFEAVKRLIEIANRDGKLISI